MSIKSLVGLAVRWERLASTFTGFIQLACIIVYLGFSDEFNV
jgi:hypothetical protein